MALRCRERAPSTTSISAAHCAASPQTRPPRRVETSTRLSHEDGAMRYAHCALRSGRHCRIGRAVPDFAEFVIGPAEGRTRWLNPGYSPPNNRNTLKASPPEASLFHFLRGVCGDPLRQEHQRGARSRIVNGKEGLHEIKAIAGECVRRKRHDVQGRHPSGGCRGAPRSISAGRLQLHDITYIATLEGPLLLDLATRHPG